ncbi:MAG: hypothetical protein V2I37_07815, partial [Marinilabiliaceae bacterium]|nr:hypothetical protein [Marinilabiliaceae bacterium]
MTSILVLIISKLAFAQMGYQEGYIITNTGDSINCYINTDRIESYPFNLEYRLEENSEVIYASATSV